MFIFFDRTTFLYLITTFLASLNLAHSSDEINLTENPYLDATNTSIYTPEPDKTEFLIFKPISFNEALSSTVNRQLQIKIAEMDIYRQLGAIQEAAGPFDPILNDAFDELAIDDEQLMALGIKSNLSSTIFNNFINVVKRTRIGTIITVSSQLTRVHDPLLYLVGNLPNSRVSVADVVTRIDQALLRGGLGRGIEFQREKAAIRELDAVKFDVLQTISQRVRDTAVAYWTLVGAIKDFKINQEVLKKFEALLTKVQKLIDAKEAAAGDILQVRATLAIKQRNQILARYNVYLAMKQLLFAMGAMDENLRCEDCDFDQIIEVFPHYPEISSNIGNLLSYTNQLVDFAIKENFNIQASSTREDVATLILQGLGNETLPQVNVFGQTRTSDFKTGDDARHLDSALYFRHPQYDWKVGATLSVPFTNDAAIGAYKQGDAVLNQTILQTMFLKEQIIRDVLVAIKNQWDLAGQIEEATKAVDYYRKVVSNEYEKLSAGFTTLFELISYENLLADSLILQNRLLADYSRNLANLRFFSGTLVNVTDMCNLTIEDLTTLPIPAKSILDKAQSENLSFIDSTCRSR